MNVIESCYNCEKPHETEEKVEEQEPVPKKRKTLKKHGTHKSNTELVIDVAATEAEEVAPVDKGDKEEDETQMVKTDK